MEEYVSKNRLMKFLDNLRQPKNPVLPAWLAQGFKYITIDEAIRVVQERPIADVVSKGEYDLLKSDCEMLRRQLKESWDRVAELDKLNGDVLQHLLELSSTLDKCKYSAGEDLQKVHYENIKWLHNHGLTDMYYDVLFGQIKAEKEAEKE